MRARVTMEQEDWRAGSAVAHPQLNLGDVDPLEREAVEHGPEAKHRRRRTPVAFP